jgi:hypothetical protein
MRSQSQLPLSSSNNTHALEANKKGHALGGVPCGEAISVFVVGVPEHLDRKVGRKRLRSSTKTDYFRLSTFYFARVFFDDV